MRYSSCIFHYRIFSAPGRHGNRLEAYHSLPTNEFVVIGLNGDFSRTFSLRNQYIAGAAKSIKNFMYLLVDPEFYPPPLKFLSRIAVRSPIGWTPLTDTTDKETNERTNDCDTKPQFIRYS